MPKTSKSQYDAVAKIIASNVSVYKHELHGLSAMIDVAHDLARYYSEDNPRFDQTRFLDACMIPTAELTERRMKAK